MNNDPAFPSNLIDGCLHLAGMTLRDYFAAKAMQAAVANPPLDMTEKGRAEFAYRLADAMMKAREAE